MRGYGRIVTAVMPGSCSSELRSSDIMWVRFENRLPPDYVLPLDCKPRPMKKSCLGGLECKSGYVSSKSGTRGANVTAGMTVSLTITHTASVPPICKQYRQWFHRRHWSQPLRRAPAGCFHDFRRACVHCFAGKAGTSVRSSASVHVNLSGE